MYFKENHTNVCSVLHLANLGGKVVVSDESLVLQGEEDVIPFDVFVKQLVELSADWDKEYRRRYANDSWDYFGSKYVPKMVIQAVTATPGQEFAEEYLERLGFQKSGPFPKLKHPGTMLTFWTINGTVFADAIGYVSKYDRRSAEGRAADVERFKKGI